METHIRVDKPPYIFPYFGGKRRVARAYGPLLTGKRIDTLYEPFAGSASFTLWAATNNIAKRYILGDIQKPLCHLWEDIIDKPNQTSDGYTAIWKRANEVGWEDHYYHVRDHYNATYDTAALLFLLTATFNATPRYRGDQFIGTPRPSQYRLPKHPDRVAKAIHQTSYLLKGRTEIRCTDWENSIQDAQRNDFIFLDPPYDSVTSAYYANMSYEHFVRGLTKLTERHISMMVSYDGVSRKRIHKRLPKHLNFTRTYAYKTIGNKDGKTHYLDTIYLFPQIPKLEDQVFQL